ncbi:glucose-6-phosphate isomerase [Candidatus Saccharibacteria bacterium]|nr:glucose-6-phosphate isomerase [Candidatus Saccharibacteria bacterium]
MIDVNFSSEIDVALAEKIIREIINDPMGGWAKLPLEVNAEELQQIKAAARKINEDSEVLVCIGIGGSYLGHRAIIEALRPQNGVEIIYAGNSLSHRELEHALNQVGNRDFSVNVISKSGTTLEPAIAFAAFKQKLIEKYGADSANQRIYATTDMNQGTLHDEAVTNHYTRFIVPDNIGGRYSVLTAVGLLPLAAAGVDIDALLKGAYSIASKIPMIAENTPHSTPVSTQENITKNPIIQYAWMRYTLSQKNYDTEVFASFEPATYYFNEWLKQLFGESEGKNRQGIFPASVIYSTDLHSLGQFMQDGRRNLWETIIDFPTDDMNAKVVAAVKKAHPMGGIPVLTLTVPSYDETGFGELIYFFEMACAISAKLFGVNPFDQPGVEAYKAELKKLL